MPPPFARTSTFCPGATEPGTAMPHPSFPGNFVQCGPSRVSRRSAAMSLLPPMTLSAALNLAISRSVSGRAGRFTERLSSGQ